MHTGTPSANGLYVNYDYIYRFDVSHRIFVPIEVEPWTFRPPPPEIRPIEIRYQGMVNLRSLLNLDLIRP